MGLLFRRQDAQDASEATDDRGGERHSTITPGVPGRCPECDGFGYIDHADLVHHTQMQHCRECGHRWEYQFDADGVLVEMIDLRGPDTPPERVRYIDLTDDAAPTVPDDPPARATSPGEPTAPRAAADEETYDKSPGEWLRDAAKS